MSKELIERVDYRGIALAAIKRARQGGESQEMLARWISEDIHAALAALTTPADGLVEELARAIEWTAGKCPNAPYVPVKLETARAIITALRAAQPTERGAIVGYRWQRVLDNGDGTDWFWSDKPMPESQPTSKRAGVICEPLYAAPATPTDTPATASRDAGEAITEARDWLKDGFISCDHCGHEQPTDGVDAIWRLDEALTALRAAQPTERAARYEEALLAIRQTGVERDSKWAGMNAHDIAREALRTPTDTPATASRDAGEVAWDALELVVNADPGPKAAAAFAHARALLAGRDRLLLATPPEPSGQSDTVEVRRVLQTTLDAIDSGRSEPLFIARDTIRNWLEDNPPTDTPATASRDAEMEGIMRRAAIDGAEHQYDLATPPEPSD